MTIRSPVGPLNFGTPIVDLKTGAPTMRFMDLVNRLIGNEGETNAVAEGAVPSSRKINTTTPITGGGDLSIDRTLAHAGSGVAAGSYANANITVDDKGHVVAASNGAAGGFSGCRCYLTADLAAVANVTTTITWTNENWDTGAFHDLVTNPSRLNILANGYAEVHLTLQRDGTPTGQWTITIRHFNSANTQIGVWGQSADSTGFDSLSVSTGPVAVTNGDYFTATYFANDASVAIKGGSGRSSFAMRIL